MPDTPVDLRDPRYSGPQARPGSKVPVYSNPSARDAPPLGISENQFTLIPETPTDRNQANTAYSSARELSSVYGPLTYGESSTEMSHRRTSSPWATTSFSHEPRMYQANNNSYEKPPIPESSDLQKDPGLPFGPSKLRLANPSSDLDFEHALLDPSKADSQSTKSYWATYGDISRADFNEYKEMVNEQFKQAQMILDSTMQEMSFLKRQHAKHNAKWQKELETALTGQDQNAAGRWSRAIRGEIRKPKLVIDQAIDREIRQIQSYGDTSAVNEEAAETASDPPLYDNLPDKLRQMAVELLLRRSQVAYILKDWKAMEYYSRQAQRLARSFKWEPFVARCAFWTGVALYHLGDWIRAYENFEAADRTKGYYIPREEILDWLTLSSRRLEDPPKLWSNLLLAVQGEQAPGFTLLGTLLEEREDLASPVTEIQTSGDEGTSLPRRSSRANAPSISAANDATLVDAPDLKHNAGFDKATSIGRGTADTVAVTPDVHIEPLKARQKTVPSAITLPSTVEPPRVRTPLLYTPGSHPVPGPRSHASMNGYGSPLSRDSDEGQNTRRSLSDLGIPSATSPPTESSHLFSQMNDYPDGNGISDDSAASSEEHLA
ncbi:MAG: hypothetical protein Q9223_006768, partial [Gallowayella weberi]